MSKATATPDITEVIRVMVNHFGTILIEQMTGAKHADLVHWIEGGMANVEQEAKLRTGYEVFTTLAERDGGAIAFRVMIGGSPLLHDGSMFDAISRGRLREALTAARVHARGDFG